LSCARARSARWPTGGTGGRPMSTTVRVVVRRRVCPAGRGYNPGLQPTSRSAVRVSGKWCASISVYTTRSGADTRDARAQWRCRLLARSRMSAAGSRAGAPAAGARGRVEVRTTGTHRKCNRTRGGNRPFTAFTTLCTCAGANTGTRGGAGVRVWHPSTTPRGIDFRVHLKLEPSCRPTWPGFRAFRKSQLWRAR
jgi:hypothetical protein